MKKLPEAVLKPAKDHYIVRERPRGPALKKEGELKPLTTFWLRRLRMGDVVRVDTEKKMTGQKKAGKGEDK